MCQPLPADQFNLELVSSSAIIAARNVNPSIFRDHWLIINEFVHPTEMGPGCVFTDAFANIVSRHFNLTVTPEQIQLTPKPVESPSSVALLGQMVRELPHTPYTGMGLNFVWHVRGEDEALLGLQRSLFKCQSRFHSHFADENCHFGAYASKDFGDCRLKLDARPLRVHHPPTKTVFPSIQFAFNFHRDLSNAEAVAEIEETLTTWTEAYEASYELVEGCIQHD